MPHDDRMPRLRIEGRVPASPPRGRRAAARPRGGRAFAPPGQSYDGTTTQWFRPVDMKLLAGDERLRLARDEAHLAIERTFTAWLRTGLAAAAVGILIASSRPPQAHGALASLLLSAALAAAGIGMLAYGARMFARRSAACGHATIVGRAITPVMAYLLAACLSALLLVALLSLWRQPVPAPPRGSTEWHVAPGVGVSRAIGRPL